MKFGTRQADVTEPDSGSKYPKYFKEGATQLVFLDEFDDWYKFFDHYSSELRKSFPCTGERDTCPGCTSENVKEQKASGKYLVNALNPKTGFVDLYKMPYSTIAQFQRYYDKESTLLGRIYEIYRGKDGNGQTTYTVDREDKYRHTDDSVFEKKQDFEEALMRQYVEAWGEEPDDSESPVQSVPKEKLDKPVKKSKKDAPKKSRDEEPIPFEDESDEIELSEDQLAKMDANELRGLFDMAGLDIPSTNDADELRTLLLEALSE